MAQLSDDIRVYRIPPASVAGESRRRADVAPEIATATAAPDLAAAVIPSDGVTGSCSTVPDLSQPSTDGHVDLMESTVTDDTTVIFNHGVTTATSKD